MKEPSAKYLARPDFKQTEVGLIPGDWEIVALSRIADCLDNLRVPLNESQRARRKGEIPYCGANGIVDYIDDFLIDDDIILMAEDGGYFDEYRTRPIAYRMRGKCWVNNHAHILKAKSGVDQGFIYYSLVHKNIVPFLASGTRAKLNRSELNKIEIPLPPTKAEQEAVAEALNDADALIESLERLLAKKRQIKQGAMQELLSGKRRLPGFASEWEVKTLGQVAPLQRGFDLPTGKLQRGPFPVVYSNGVLAHHVAFQVKGPGVVTGRSGTIGNVTFVEQDFWPHNTALWVTSFKGNDPKFVFYLFIQVGLERFATGSGVPTLNRNDVHAFNVSIPATRDEQAAIATVLSDMDADVATLEAKLAKASQLKQGMMQGLLTGRIRFVEPARVAGSIPC